MIRRTRKLRAGITMLELMVSVVLTVLIFNLTAGAFVMAGRISAMSTLAIDRLEGVAEVQAVFTETVRNAEAVLPGATGFTTSADRVVLRTADGITVFGRLGDSAQVGVMRLEERDGAWESEYLRPLRQAFSSITFQVEGSRLVQMDLQVRRDPAERAGNPAQYRAVAGCRGRAVEVQP